MINEYALYNTETDMFGTWTSVQKYHENDEGEVEKECVSEEKLVWSAYYVSRSRHQFPCGTVAVRSMTFYIGHVNMARTNENCFGGFFNGDHIQFIPIVCGEPDFTRLWGLPRGIITEADTDE